MTTCNQPVDVIMHLNTLERDGSDVAADRVEKLNTSKLESYINVGCIPGNHYYKETTMVTVYKIGYQPNPSVGYVGNAAYVDCANHP